MPKQHQIGIGGRVNQIFVMYALYMWIILMCLGLSVRSTITGVSENHFYCSTLY